MIDERALDKLREQVKGYMGEHRYLHTLGVEKMAKYLADILLPSEAMDIRASALLHDIAKEMPIDEQIRFASECQGVTNEDLATLPALHSFAGVGVIKRDFPIFASEKILGAVFNHTLGGENMSIFEEIIFISDYIEEGRTYSSCINTRELLLKEISLASGREEQIKALHRATLNAIDFTIDFLNKRGIAVNSRTQKAKIAYESLI